MAVASLAYLVIYGVAPDIIAAQRMIAGVESFPLIAVPFFILAGNLMNIAGVTGRIKSPTYAVVEPHQAGSGDSAWPIWHFDFYRFNDPQEWEDAGFRDIFAGPGLKLMEWPDKVAGQLPPPDWVIALDALDEDRRRVHISAGTPRGQQWLQSWLAFTAGQAHAR